MAAPRETPLPGNVQALVDQIGHDLGVYPLEVVLTGSGAHRVLRVVVDTLDLAPEAVLDVDVVADMSRQLSAALDEHDPIPGSYTLEVTSPGADRRLTTFRDFARNRGRRVRLVRHAEGEAEVGQPVEGELVAATEQELTLQIDGREVTITLESVDHGNVVLPW